jgi:hypothetical protein
MVLVYARADCGVLHEYRNLPGIVNPAALIMAAGVSIFPRIRVEAAMTLASWFGLRRNAAGDGRAITPPPAARSTLLLLSLIFSACAANTGRGPSITVTDFRARNIERLHDGIPSLVGEDSAGIAAREYVKSFEEELGMRLPTQAAMPEPYDQDPILPDNGELVSLPSSSRYDYTAQARVRELGAPSTDPKVLELKRWLDGRKVEAIGDLRAHNTAFSSGGGKASAKLGLSAAYVAVSCANEPNEVETITALVEPLLTALSTE